MSHRFLIAVLVLSAVLSNSFPVAAQSKDSAKLQFPFEVNRENKRSEKRRDRSLTFEGGPLSVTIFDGTGVASEQTAVEFPIGAGEAVELITIPVDIKVPARYRAFLVVQFVGNFSLPLSAVSMALDCTVDGELTVEFGCGITPFADFDFTSLPRPPAGAPGAIIPATFLIRGLSPVTHQIGIQVEASTAHEGITRGLFFPATSSLIVSLYAEKRH